jgi:hypothetical protein
VIRAGGPAAAQHHARPEPRGERRGRHATLRRGSW